MGRKPFPERGRIRGIIADNRLAGTGTRKALCVSAQSPTPSLPIPATQSPITGSPIETLLYVDQSPIYAPPCSFFTIRTTQVQVSPQDAGPAIRTAKHDFKSLTYHRSVSTTSAPRQSSRVVLMMRGMWSDSYGEYRYLRAAKRVLAALTRCPTPLPLPYLPSPS